MYVQFYASQKRPYLLIFSMCANSFSVVGGFEVTKKMAEAEAVDVGKKNEDWGEAKEEEKSQEELIKESIAAAVMKVLIQSCAH